MEDLSDIQQFYKDQTIFITGGSGFIGKVLLEKLLRVCYNLSAIYILIRPKRGKTPEQRFNDIFDYACFDRLKSEMPNFHEKVHLISGDCDKAGLGIGQRDREILKEKVTILFHAAANVTFNQVLRLATNSNVRAVTDALEMAKEMAQLKAFVYISTAYSNCPRTYVREKFYEPGIKAKNLFALVDAVDDKILDALTPDLIQDWPNTYTFTKCIAEDVIRTEMDALPVAIVRPAIIVSTYEDPLPGWVDNFYGMTGAGVGVMTGALKNIYGDDDTIIFTVPCDYVVNNVIASPWDLNTRKPTTLEECEYIIYNYVGSHKSAVTLKNWTDNISIMRWTYPFNMMLWFPMVTVTKSATWFKIRCFFQHTLLVYIIDLTLICTGKKAVAVKKLEKVHQYLDLTSYFILNTWHFDCYNVETLWKKMSEKDRKLFTLNMDDFNWNRYWRYMFQYGRVFLMNDSLETLHKARRKVILFAVIHYLF
ncbi:fatty acyl-CoA reductase CG5065-like, partial [Asbolus verrucosus]